MEELTKNSVKISEEDLNSEDFLTELFEKRAKEEEEAKKKAAIAEKARKLEAAKALGLTNLEFRRRFLSQQRRKIILKFMSVSGQYGNLNREIQALEDLVGESPELDECREHINNDYVLMNHIRKVFSFMDSHPNIERIPKNLLAGM